MTVGRDDCKSVHCRVVNLGSSTFEASGDAVIRPPASSSGTVSTCIASGFISEISIALSSDTPVSMASHARLGSSVLPLWYRRV